MKKIFLILLLSVIFLGEGYTQVKVNFTLENPRILAGFWVYDLKANVPAGQVWRPASCNIRINFSSVPAGVLTVKADDPMINANPNISNANGYQAMKTTSLLSGTVLSANILNLNTSGFYRFTTGSYLLGTLRWTPSGSFTNTTMTFRIPPDASPTLVTDSTLFLVSGTTFTTTNPLVTGSYIISSEIPSEFKLYENYPNPFNPSTAIKFDIPANSFVRLVVYDITGKEAAVLLNENKPAGSYETTWSGKEFSSGVYFARLEAGSYTHIIKMLMVK